MIKKFLEAMDNDKEYDFIANNYTNMSKFELRSILLEYIYATHSVNHIKLLEEVEDEIKDEIRDAVRNELEIKEIFG